MMQDGNGGYSDLFNEMVLSGRSTKDAWQKEYDRIIKDSLMEKSSSNIDYLSISIFGEIPFGQTFDIDYPLEFTLIFLNFTESDFSPEKLSQIIVESHDVLISLGIIVEKYMFTFRCGDNDTSRIYLSDITRPYINEGLTELIREMIADSQDVYVRTGISFTLLP